MMKTPSASGREDEVRRMILKNGSYRKYVDVESQQTQLEKQQTKQHGVAEAAFAILRLALSAVVTGALVFLALTAALPPAFSGPRETFLKTIKSSPLEQAMASFPYGSVGACVVTLGLVLSPVADRVVFRHVIYLYGKARIKLMTLKK